MEIKLEILFKCKSEKSSVAIGVEGEKLKITMIRDGVSRESEYVGNAKEFLEGVDYLIKRSEGSVSVEESGK